MRYIASKVCAWAYGKAELHVLMRGGRACNWGERATGATHGLREGAESRLFVGVGQAVHIVLWGLDGRRHSVELDHDRGDNRWAISGTAGRHYRLQRQERHRGGAERSVTCRSYRVRGKGAKP